MIKHRKQIISWLFEITQKVYTRYFKKNKPWNISKDELLNYPQGSIGNHLGNFLKINGFDIIPKAERHDVYHIITGYNSEEQDEIALQYLCFGNGKRSLYLIGVIIIGTLLLPDYYKYYIKSFRIGKKANAFHGLEYTKLLKTSLKDLRFSIFTNHNISCYKQAKSIT